MLKLKDGYYAKDKDNTICRFTNKPFIYDTWWENESKRKHVLGIEITEPWEDSLYHVKDGIATKVVTFTKDQKVLVRDNLTDTWKRRHYSHEENDIHYVYGDGTTSWTSVCATNFNYIKPYIEGEDEC